MKTFTIKIRGKEGYSKNQMEKWAEEIAGDADKEVIVEGEEG